MDFSNLTDKAMGFVVNHGVALSWLTSVAGRQAESGTGGVGTGLGTDIFNEFQVYFGLDPAQPASGAGALYELTKSFRSIDDLKWKLLDSPHVPTSLFKVSLGIWAIGKLTDFIPATYVKLAGKAAVGSAIAALTLPGSEPYNRPAPAQRAAPNGSPQMNQSPVMNYTIQG